MLLTRTLAVFLKMKKRTDFYENIDLWCRCDWILGSLYAVLFAETGYDTSIYARGKRLEFLKKNGLLYKKNQNIRRAGTR